MEGFILFDFQRPRSGLEERLSKLLGLAPRNKRAMIFLVSFVFCPEKHERHDCNLGLTLT